MKSFPLQTLPLRRSQVAFNKAFSYLHFYIRSGTSRSVSSALVRPTAKRTHRPVIGDASYNIPVTFRIPYISSFSTAPKNVIEYTFSRNPHKSDGLDNARDAAAPRHVTPTPPSPRLRTSHSLAPRTPATTSSRRVVTRICNNTLAEVPRRASLQLGNGLPYKLSQDIE